MTGQKPADYAPRSSGVEFGQHRPGPGDGDRPHQPIVAALALGGWGVYCDACSHAAHDYVYPCKVRPDGPWPPGKLHAHEDDPAPDPVSREEIAAALRPFLQRLSATDEATSAVLAAVRPHIDALQRHANVAEERMRIAEAKQDDAVCQLDEAQTVAACEMENCERADAALAAANTENERLRQQFRKDARLIEELIGERNAESERIQAVRDLCDDADHSPLHKQDGRQLHVGVAPSDIRSVLDAEPGRADTAPEPAIQDGPAWGDPHRYEPTAGGATEQEDSDGRTP